MLNLAEDVTEEAQVPLINEFPVGAVLTVSQSVHCLQTTQEELLLAVLQRAQLESHVRLLPQVPDEFATSPVELKGHAPKEEQYFRLPTSSTLAVDLQTGTQFPIAIPLTSLTIFK